MIKKMLIANRGEIAIRIAKTCRKRGISPIGLYTEGNEQELYLDAMDESWRLSGKTLQETWLNADAIIKIGKQCGADSIHPGYGFLSEQEHFARKCTDASLLFIGPSSEVIAKMGDKSQARKIAEELDIPIIPGHDHIGTDPEIGQKIAKKIGFPLLLKAAAGGGGKGMKHVFRAEELPMAFEQARSEAQRTFGDDRIILEKLFTQVRHIEVQIAGDQFGSVIHLFERDCSLQRRHQKIIEESPAPFLTDSFRQKICDAAVRLSQGVSYTGVGTVEFLADVSTPESESFYFLEMNTRIQVEHPVTEQITGLDLIDLQIQLHQGLPLQWKQADLKTNGHAMECRIYAEDPDQNFMPSSGTIFDWKPCSDLGNIRIESGIKSGDKVSIEFDPMLAKIIAHGESRDECLTLLKRFLDQSVLWGIKSNMQFLSQIVSDQDFANRPFCTGELEALHTKIKNQASPDQSTGHLIPGLGLILSHLLQPIKSRAWGQICRGFSNTLSVNQTRTIDYNGQKHVLSAIQNHKSSWTIERFDEGNLRQNNNSGLTQMRILEFTMETKQSGKICIESDHRITNLFWYTDQASLHDEKKSETYQFKNGNGSYECSLISRFGQNNKTEIADQKEYEAPVTARVSKVWGDSGVKVKPGDPLIALEAMKMEHVIYAQKSGVIQSIHCNLNQLVEAGQLLITLHP